ncbi:hypothetical protein AGMMS50256_38210 [Betaproteobacteria bacterium]|nr:hypothetical protein AGMMS50256_38210 [Betaproteobacteria bacterium]
MPRHIRHYSVPGYVLAGLPPPPHRHRYVLVGNEVLLINNRTGFVVDSVYVLR